MIRALALCGAMIIAPVLAVAEAASTGTGGIIRVLDKITGSHVDLELLTGQTERIGHLTVTMGECRYPASNPSGDAWGWLVIHYQNGPEPIFAGWMVASAPALSALDHPRYDVWPLRCLTP